MEIKIRIKIKIKNRKPPPKKVTCIRDGECVDILIDKAYQMTARSAGARHIGAPSWMPKAS
jgi:hypothetical protein